MLRDIITIYQIHVMKLQFAAVNRDSIRSLGGKKFADVISLLDAARWSLWPINGLEILREIKHHNHEWKRIHVISLKTRFVVKRPSSSPPPPK